MQRLAFACLFFVSLFMVSGGKGQMLSKTDKPMWTIEVIRVKPAMFGFALGYLDDNWMQVREEAKRQGVVLSYARLAEQDTQDSAREIVLITEFKNGQAYLLRDSFFASIRKRLPNSTPGLLRPEKQDLYETVSAGTFLEYPETANVPRLLSKN
jgi:hypothetical protein